MVSSKSATWDVRDVYAAITEAAYLSLRMLGKTLPRLGLPGEILRYVLNVSRL